MKATPILRACCLARSWPLTQTFTGRGQQVQILMNAGPDPVSRRQKQQTVTRRSFLPEENCGHLPGPVRRWAPEGVPGLLQARRRRHRVPAVPEERDHLPAHLQLAEITVQAETAQAVQVQLHVTIQHIVEDALTCTNTPAQPPASAVSGGACLDA